MERLHPICLEASLHATIWGGSKLARDQWKPVPPNQGTIGEAWETETSTIARNAPYEGQTLGALVNELGQALLGEQAIAIFGQRFPLLAKFIDATAKLSVQVHPDDAYARQHEGGKLGKTEFWYILDAEPGATIVYGFKVPTSRAAVEQAIKEVTLEDLLHEEEVHAGDVIFVPAGTVHAIGSGVLLYELQEYSDVTYRMYDYGRLTADGTPRQLHIERSLDVSCYSVAPRVKIRPVALEGGKEYKERCLVACRYFITRELRLGAGLAHPGALQGQTKQSCIILSSLEGEAHVRYGPFFEERQPLRRGQSMVLPAALGDYRIEGHGVLLTSYVPEPDDYAWKAWAAENR